MFAKADPPETVSAVTSSATYIGKRTGAVARFNAIRYAAPPVGQLRFAAPEPVKLTGEVDATQPGPIAPQLPSRLREAMGDFDLPRSEDCLHLTIWTSAPDGAKRPVVVWLHGGAWQSGAGALDWYDGSSLAQRGDIVVVAVNYRLAALGWLHAEGAVSNVGLLDQELALQWVVDHIAAFGGNPDQITVMGQSAGGSNIVGLLTRKPVFHRAILQSAALGRGFRPADAALALGRALLSAAGATSVGAARSLPVENLLQAQRAPEVLEVLQAQPGSLSMFSPVLDGETLPVSMAEVLSRATGRVDVLVGATRNEMAAFPNTMVNDETDQIGDQIFGIPGRKFAADTKAAGRKAWEYRFDVGPTKRFGACHCIELPFVFGTLEAFATAPMLTGLSQDDGERVTHEVQDAWIAFIRGDAPAWGQSPELHVFN